jgi:26S proteasome regulatory subunit N9
MYKCEELIKSVRSELEKRFEVDQIVYSSFYKLSLLYYKRKENFDEFYTNALQFLAYVKDNVRIT